jgi:hypothetical protein
MFGVIAKSSVLASRASFAATPMQALDVYNDACNTFQSQTKYALTKSVLLHNGIEVVLDGLFEDIPPFNNTFIYKAFILQHYDAVDKPKTFKPMLLKVKIGIDASYECDLYSKLKENESSDFINDFINKHFVQVQIILF